MEDVKDTLWKWAIQLSALAGLGYSTLSTISFLGLLISHRDTPVGDLRFILAFGFVIGPLLGAVWLQLVYMKKWAAWLIWSLATLIAVFYGLVATAFSPIYGLAIAAPPAIYSALLFCALLFKPRLWREGL